MNFKRLLKFDAIVRLSHGAAWDTKLPYLVTFSLSKGLGKSYREEVPNDHTKSLFLSGVLFRLVTIHYVEIIHKNETQQMKRQSIWLPVFSVKHFKQLRLEQAKFS